MDSAAQAARPVSFRWTGDGGASAISLVLPSCRPCHVVKLLRTIMLISVADMKYDRGVLSPR